MKFLSGIGMRGAVVVLLLLATGQMRATYQCAMHEVVAGKINDTTVHDEITDDGSRDFCGGIREWCRKNINQAGGAVDCQVHALGDPIGDARYNLQTIDQTALADFINRGFFCKNNNCIPLSQAVDSDLGAQWAKYIWHRAYDSIDIFDSCFLNWGDYYNTASSEFYGDFCTGLNDWCQNLGDDNNKKACKKAARIWIQAHPADPTLILDGRKLPTDSNQDVNSNRGKNWAWFWWTVGHGTIPNVDIWSKGLCSDAAKERGLSDYDALCNNIVAGCDTLQNSTSADRIICQQYCAYAIDGSSSSILNPTTVCWPAIQNCRAPTGPVVKPLQPCLDACTTAASTCTTNCGNKSVCKIGCNQANATCTATCNETYQKRMKTCLLPTYGSRSAARVTWCTSNAPTTFGACMQDPLQYASTAAKKTWCQNNVSTLRVDECTNDPIKFGF